MVIEKLECRQLLSTTAGMDVHGVVVVQLDNSGGNVVIDEFAHFSPLTSNDVQVADPTLPGGIAFFTGATGIKVLGGAGSDSIIINHVENVPVTISAGDGNDTVGVAADVFQPGVDTFASGSNIDGGNGSNLIVVGGVNNSVITAGNGNDTIIAGAFATTSTTTLGGENLTIRGGGGDDSIFSGFAGGLVGLTDSTLDGGTGNDTITDTGSDNFINGGAGSDIITATISDFVVPAHGDVITRI